MIKIVTDSTAYVPQKTIQLYDIRVVPLYVHFGEEAYKEGMKPWELINVALWEKIGEPDHDTLMNYVANVRVDDDDPKWLKRLKITAAHEVAMAAVRTQRVDAEDEAETARGSDNGD